MRRLPWLLIVTLLIGVNNVHAAGETVVTLDSATLNIGETDVVEAAIECQADLCSAFSISIAFEPDVIRVDSVDLGTYLGEDVFEVENEIDNSAGTLTYAAVTLGMPEPSDETVLFAVHVTALSAGETPLRIVELQVGDENGEQLATLGVDGMVTVGQQITGRVNTASANLRSYPATNASVLGTARRGTELPIVERAGNGDNRWYQVLWEGETVWIWGALLDVEHEDEVIPVSSVMPRPMTTRTPTPAPQQGVTPVPGAGSPGGAPAPGTGGGGSVPAPETGGSNPSPGTAGGGGTTPVVDPNDRDGDGIPNDSDTTCPDEPGPMTRYGWGCPDRDGDQVADYVDQCPDVPGSPVLRIGCPIDSDGDGTVEDNDQCPSEPGPTENNGCPLPTEPQSTEAANAIHKAPDDWIVLVSQTGTEWQTL